LPEEVVAIHSTAPFSFNAYLHAVANGNEAVYEECFAYVFSCVCRFLHGKVPDLDEALIEEAAQYTLSQIWLKAVTYRNNTNQQAWGWISKIAHHKGLDLIKAQRRLIDLDLESYPRGKVPSPLIVKNNNTLLDLIIDLKMFREGLSPRQKEAFDLLCKGYKNKKIAEQMGISKERVSQLIGKIQEKLAKYSKD